MPCWCGTNHNLISQRGGAENGPIKHSVINWKFYDLRKDGQSEEPVIPKNNFTRRTPIKK